MFHLGKAHERDPDKGNECRPGLMPWTECRKSDGPLRLEGWREVLCGCPDCHPELWCSGLGPAGGRCLRLRVRNGDARGTPYCPEHYREIVLGDADGLPIEFLRAVVLEIKRAEAKGRLVIERNGWCSLAGILAAKYLPLAHRAGLCDEMGRATFAAEVENGV